MQMSLVVMPIALTLIIYSACFFLPDPLKCMQKVEHTHLYTYCIVDQFSLSHMLLFGY